MVVLDLMLPGVGGMDVLAKLREVKPDLPVIVLTARGEIEDRVAGLDAGAVDYLVKPFSLAELLARVRAQLRVAAQTSTTTLQAADIEVNLLTRKVRRAGEPAALSTTEFELLVYLMRHRGEVLSREQILSTVWGYQHDPSHQRRGRVCRLSAPQARASRQPRSDLHRAQGRLPARRWWLGRPSPRQR